MATEVTDLAADLLAALGSSVAEEPTQNAQPTHPAEPDAPASTTTAAPAEPIATTTFTTPAVPAIEPPPEITSVPSPKRRRTPNLTDSTDAKRQKTDHDAPSVDMAMLLESALGSFDEQLNPPTSTESIDVQVIPAVRSATATPAPAKPEPKLMRASDNPIFMLRSMSLPVLGNLAVQILLRLAQQTRAETQALLADKETEYWKTYETLRSMFGPTRKAFSDSALLLSCDELDISDSEDRETIRMANLATVGLSVYDTQSVPLTEIHDQFLSIFVSELGEYKESLTDFYLGLKTQAFLMAKQDLAEGQTVSGLLDQYFPVDFEDSIKERNGEAFLNFGEDLLVAAIKERREVLTKAANDEDSSSSRLPLPGNEEPPAPQVTLTEQFPAENLLNDFGAYLQTHLSVIVEYAEKYGVNIPVAEELTEGASPTDAIAQQSIINDDLAALLQSATARMTEEAEVGAEAEVEEVAPKEEDSALSDGLGLSNIIQESLKNDMDLASLIRENLDEAAEAKIHSAYTMPSYASINGEVNGEFSSAQPLDLPSLTVSRTTAIPVPGSAEPAACLAISLVHTGSTAGRPLRQRKWRHAASKPVFANGNLVREGTSSRGCKVLFNHPARRSTLHA